MRKDCRGEANSMSEDSSSPTSNSRKTLIKSRRKLPFSENISSPDPEPCKEKKNKLNESTSSSSLTPRRNTPLSERQQIALLCRLSSGDSSSNDISPSESEGVSLKRNERGETALHLATIKGDIHKVHSLLKQGVNVNTADFAGWTALHEACNHGWFKIAKLLIEFGANVNALGFEKFTPLHDAAINQHEDIVNLLLKHGANPLQENAKHRTPIESAGSEKISRILTQALDHQKQTSFPEVLPLKQRLRSCEAAEKSEASPSAVCDLTMRKNSPHNQTHKGADKPTSPRLTLRFQSIRSRDEKSSSSAKVTDISSAQPKYPSYCVTMEAKGDVYDFRKEDATVSSSQSVSSTSETEGTTKCEAVSSTSKEADESSKSDDPVEQDPQADEKMDTSDALPSKINGGRTSVDSSCKERDSSVDVDKEETRRKRRKSNDSTRSNKGHKSPSHKNSDTEPHGSQKSPKTRKRGSQSSSDTESNPSDAEVHPTDPNIEANYNGSSSSSGPHSPKVPPLKIVLPSGSGSLELETRERSNKVSSSKQALPYVVNTTMADSAVDSIDFSCPVEGSSKDCGAKSETPGKTDPHTEERFQRVTRSSQRMQAAMSGVEPSSSTQVVSSSSGPPKVDGSGESSNDEQIPLDVHPRKRKLRQREATESASQNPSSASSSSEDPSQQQQFNSYQMFLNIRKQVDKRRRNMFIVHPKPPQGFKDYLLNKCEYVLEGNAASRLSVPTITPPQSLDGAIKELFIQQEKERYRLRLQQLIEKEKLILAVEQETLRVHGRAARAMANQTVPLSACSILKDEEIYNIIEDDKDKNIRSRYNGRLFLSWLEDVNDKWKTIKEKMLLRHHNEAESLYAVQKLDWEWKLKELSMVDIKATPVIDDIFVPMVHVNDEFQLLPNN